MIFPGTMHYLFSEHISQNVLEVNKGNLAVKIIDQKN